jgi:hypothetical protein
MHRVGFSSGLSFPRYSYIANVAIGPAFVGAGAPIPTLLLTTKFVGNFFDVRPYLTFLT